MGGSGLVAGWIRRIPDIECVAQGFSGDPRIGKIRIPLFVQLAVNPQLNYMNLVIGLSF